MSADPVKTDHFEINRRNWNDRAEVHARDASGFYQVDAFKRGADTLTPIEASEIGDVTGLRALHLQCHFGLDTLSLARRGAIVTGLDFSDRAIGIARSLAAELGIAATFVEGNVYDVRDLVEGPFDLVYATWGVFCWIPDARLWIANAAELLAPGGRLYLADDHPSTAQLGEEPGPDGRPRLVVNDHWRTPTDVPLEFDEPQTYTGDAISAASGATREWIHPLSDFLGAVADAGLTLVSFREHDRVPWQRFPSMQSVGGGLWALPTDRPGVPLAFSLSAVRRP